MLEPREKNSVRIWGYIQRSADVRGSEIYVCSKACRNSRDDWGNGDKHREQN